MCNELITALKIMSMPPVTLQFKKSIKVIAGLLEQYEFDGFPIINGQRQCIGLITRFQLLTIIQKVDKIAITKQSKAKEYDELNNTVLPVSTMRAEAVSGHSTGRKPRLTSSG